MKNIENFEKTFLPEYVLKGYVNDHILVIRHKKCGAYFTYNLNGNSMVDCVCCARKSENEAAHDIVFNEAEEHTYIHYLSTSDYAKKHSREKKQIHIHCLRGRFDGAIQLCINNKFLIPADAPYPVDKRLKENR